MIALLSPNCLKYVIQTKFGNIYYQRMKLKRFPCTRTVVYGICTIIRYYCHSYFRFTVLTLFSLNQECLNIFVPISTNSLVVTPLRSRCVLCTEYVLNHVERSLKRQIKKDPTTTSELTPC